MKIKKQNLKKKKKTLEEKVAYRNHVVTDMGNGASFCSNCDYNFGPDPLKSYKKCPGCDYKLKDGSMYINSGGSDF